MRSLRPLDAWEDPARIPAKVAEWMGLPWVHRCGVELTRGADMWDGGDGSLHGEANDSATITIRINGGARERRLPEPPEIERNKGQSNATSKPK